MRRLIAMFRHPSMRSCDRFGMGMKAPHVRFSKGFTLSCSRLFDRIFPRGPARKTCAR
jgi:hypothetical protein